MNKSLRHLLAFLLLALWLPSAADACTVPVFRYALDRWAADAYRLEAPAAALRSGPAGADLRGESGARLNIVAIPQPDDAGSQAVLRFPAETGDTGEAWSGELSPAAYRNLTDSPARSEIARRLLNGDSAVWILIESGRREDDDRIAKLLTEQMALAEKQPLPTTRPNDPSSQIGPGPKLHVKFSLLRVSRDAADETFFVTSLAGPGGLAALPKDEPFAALVFGRGRVLGAWSPEKLSPELIQQASRFLLGACSCEAKHLNPGWDLLMRTNWDAELEQSAKAQGAATTQPAVKPEVVVYESAPATRPAAENPSGNLLNTNVLIGMAAGVLVIFGFAFFVMRRRS